MCNSTHSSRGFDSDFDQAVVQQKSILELLTKRKTTGDHSSGAQVDEISTQESSVGSGVEVVVSSIGPSIIPTTEPASVDSFTRDDDITLCAFQCYLSFVDRSQYAFLAPQTSNHPAGKATSVTALDVVIDVSDDDSDLQQSRSGSSMLPIILSKSSRLALKLPIRAGHSSSTSRSHSVDGGTRDDPIILDSSSPVKPDMTIPLAKPTYSIFAPRNKNPKPPKPATQVSQVKSKRRKGDETMQAPFPDADSQHIRGPQSNFNALPLHFGRRKKAKAMEIIDVDEVPPNLSSLRQYILDSRPQLLGRRPIRFTQSLDRDEYINTIPTEHIRSHPIIRHILKQPASFTTGSSQELWTDKWCPQRADHVLGNEHHALYLRDWLRALELQLEVRPDSPQKPSVAKVVRHNSKNGAMKKEKGVKRQRPRVVRAVAKKKGRKRQRIDSDEDEDDWIINTDEETEEDEWEEHEEGTDADNDTEEDDVEFCRKQGLSRLRRMESSPIPASSPPPTTHVPISLSELHNTLLLSGPPGSGKTAAVYACAREMGWEVFEVYPGIGKRSGQCLDQLVGEVGKNHLVRKTGGAKRVDSVKNAFAEIFGGGEIEGDKRTMESNGVVNVQDSSGTGDFGFMVELTDTSAAQFDPDAEEQTDNSSPPIRGVRQSFILLEEVDILFDEDRGFWPTVVNIIRDCKRPVVMTCNGKSRR